MRFFERKGENALVPKFETNEELEGVLDEYVRLRIKTVQIGMDVGIPITPEQKQQAQTQLDGNSEYQEAKGKLDEIKRQYDKRLKIYLQPYIVLESVSAPPSALKEYNRWYVAVVLRTEQKHKP